MAIDFKVTHFGWGRTISLEVSRVTNEIQLGLVLACMGKEGIFTNVGIALSLAEAEQLSAALTGLIAEYHEQRKQVAAITEAALAEQPVDGQP